VFRSAVVVMASRFLCGWTFVIEVRLQLVVRR
jgi:hypothetical protein